MRALKTNAIGSHAAIITDGFLEGLAMDNFIAFDSVIIRRYVLIPSVHLMKDFATAWTLSIGGVLVWLAAVRLSLIKLYLNGLNMRTVSVVGTQSQ